jgi:hypothetical protein
MNRGAKVDVDGIASDWEDDCLNRVKVTVHGKAPDGTPAEIQSSWCGKYKPGREPAGH